MTDKISAEDLQSVARELQIIRNQIPAPQPLGRRLCSFWSGAGPQDGLGQEGLRQKCAKSELSKIK